MDSKRILEIADAIERQEIATFDMTHVVEQVTNDENHHPCGTAACVGGFALIMYMPFWKMQDDPHWEERAGEVLGLTDQQATELFLAFSLDRYSTLNEDGDTADVSLFESFGSRETDGLRLINELRAHVPAALRYMVEQNDIHWRRALNAVVPKVDRGPK